MATLKVKLDKRKVNKQGEYPVKIQLCHNKNTVVIPVGYHVLEKDWIGDGLLRPVAASAKSAKIINDKIEGFYFRLRHNIDVIEISGDIDDMTVSEVKDYIMQSKKGEKKKEEKAEKPVGFREIAEDFIKQARAEKTKGAYRYTVEKVMKYVEECEMAELALFDVTLPFLRGFDRWLEVTGSGINTRSIHFRNIRAVFNRAIDDDLIAAAAYPFRKFKIRQVQREKDCLSPAQVRTLYNMTELTPGERTARDFWMLSFFLCGVNPVDLFHLRKPDENGRVSFVRQKMQHATQDDVRITLQPEALAITAKYAADDESEFLLNFYNQYVSYESFYHFAAKCVRRIADRLGFKGMSLYWARYSWSTIADSLDVSEKVIDKALGHGDKTMAGRKYIAFDWSKVDRANRKVIDAILCN